MRHMQETVHSCKNSCMRTHDFCFPWFHFGSRCADNGPVHPLRVTHPGRGPVTLWRHRMWTWRCPNHYHHMRTRARHPVHTSLLHAPGHQERTQHSDCAKLQHGRHARLIRMRCLTCIFRRRRVVTLPLHWGAASGEGKKNQLGAKQDLKQHTGGSVRQATPQPKIHSQQKPNHSVLENRGGAVHVRRQQGWHHCGIVTDRQHGFGKAPPSIGHIASVHSRGRTGASQEQAQGAALGQTQKRTAGGAIYMHTTHMHTTHHMCVHV